MKKLKEIKKSSDNKFINTFIYKYNVDGKDFNYEVASRRDKKDLYVFNENKTDAVRVLPYFWENNKLKIVLIEEFRYALNKYIFAIPAGLIDGDEEPEEAVKRELMEEIGARTLNLKCVEKSSPTSAGLTDENAITFEAEVELCGKQNLDGLESINVKIVELDELPNMLDNLQFTLPSRLQLRAFYYKNKIL